MTRTDPYTAESGTYECVGCGRREAGDANPGTCPDCGSAVRNIAVPRE